MVKALNTASEKLAHKEDNPAEKPAKKSVQCVKVRLPSMHAAARCAPQSLMLRLCRSLKRKPEFNERSITDFVVLLQGVKGRYKRPLTSRDFIGL